MKPSQTSKVTRTFKKIIRKSRRLETPRPNSLEDSPHKVRVKAPSSAISKATGTNDNTRSGHCDEADRENRVSPRLLRNESSGEFESFDDRDRKETKLRYIEAVTQLNDLLKTRSATWEPIDIPTFNDLIDDHSFHHFQESLSKILKQRDAKRNASRQSNESDKKNIIERIFVAVSPLAKNVLRIARHSSAVIDFSYTFTDVADGCIESIRRALWRAFDLNNR